MKRAFCVIAGACSLLGWAPADETGMNNVLEDWRMRPVSYTHLAVYKRQRAGCVYTAPFLVALWHNRTMVPGYAW